MLDETPIVLLVDDDPLVLRVLARVVQAAGFVVEILRDGREAADLASRRHFDAIVSDIGLPGLDGFELLRQVRRADPDVPFLFVTGNPSVESAAEAIEHGAVRYLSKPVPSAKLIASIAEAVRVGRMARARREVLAHVGGAAIGEDDEALGRSLDRALQSLFLVVQPIVQWSTRRPRAWEALLRSSEPSLPTPPAVIRAAERLGRLPDVGRAVRLRAADIAADLYDGEDLFVNLHPADLADPMLFDAAEPLSQVAPRVVLEITERARLDTLDDLAERLHTLRRLGFRIAIDDLGSGYAGLSSFVDLSPEIVKVDMSLVRHLDTDPTRGRLVRMLATTCAESGVEMVAEGVETVGERDALRELGCDLMQGYLFAKPARPFGALSADALLA